MAVAAFGNLFWGVILKPGKRYEQTVEESFHISKACMEPQSGSGSGKVVSVYIEVVGDEYLLCNLSSNPASGLNESLDLNFNVGEKICFRTEGEGTVHLTGYLVPDDEFGNGQGEYDMTDSDEEEEMEEEESDSDDEDDDEAPKLIKKRKMENGGSFTLMPLGSLSKKAKKAMYDGAPQVVELDDEDEDDDDMDEEDDDDDDVSDLEEEEEEEDVKDIKPKNGQKAKFAGSTPFKAGAKKGGGQDQSVSTPSKSSAEETQSSSGDASSSKKKKRNKKKNKKNMDSSTASSDPTSTPDASSPKKEAKNGKAPTPGKKGGAATPAAATPKQSELANKTPKRTLKGGVMVEDLKVGNGPEAGRGKMVGMYYEGRLKSSNKKFDENKSGKPFRFRLGSGEVIKGWDVGIEGMKVGGKRRLVVPAHMAYGSQGAGADIPPNSTLVFDVECKTVN